jgi:hypothetical protein
MKADTPLAPSRAVRGGEEDDEVRVGAVGDPVLAPSMTKSSPCRVATVCMLLASEPLPAR